MLSALKALLGGSKSQQQGNGNPPGPEPKAVMSLDQIIESLEDMHSIDAVISYEPGNEARIHNLQEYAEGLDKYNDRIIKVKEVKNGVVVIPEQESWMEEDFPPSLPFVFLRPHSKMDFKLDI
jgi:hypothetical protein